MLKQQIRSQVFRLKTASVNTSFKRVVSLVILCKAIQVLYPACSIIQCDKFLESKNPGATMGGTCTESIQNCSNILLVL